MASLLTNVSAITALQNLSKTDKELQTTQERISTGLRVGSASDNAAYWSIATTLRSDNVALSTVQDALGLGSSTVDVTYTALNSTIGIVSDIKAKLVAARQPGVDKSKIQEEIKALQSQLRGVAEAATFSGQNWLQSDSSLATYNGTRSIVSSFSRTAGAVTVGTIDVDITQIELFDVADKSGILDTASTTPNGGVAYSIAGATDGFDISALTDSASDTADLEALIQTVDDGLETLTDAASALGAVQSRINLQKDFVKVLRDSLDKGVGTLVDADLNEESTRLQALQVRQQLGVQSLSIANQSSQAILTLFQQ